METVSVYALCNEDEMFYIGITNNTRRRLNEHRKQAVGGNRNMTYCKWRSLEVEPTLKVLAKGLSRHEACLLETKLIASFGRRDKGDGILTNHSDGGEGGSEGFIASDAFREMRRQVMLGHTINVGRKRPDMTERFSKKVIACTIDREFSMVYDSQRQAAEDIGVHYDSINRVITKRKGKTKLTTPLGVLTFINLD